MYVRDGQVAKKRLLRLSESTMALMIVELCTPIKVLASGIQKAELLHIIEQEKMEAFM